MKFVCGCIELSLVERLGRKLAGVPSKTSERG
jgi:hypothetical protein